MAFHPPSTSSIAIGNAIGSGTSGSVLFVDSTGKLAQANTNFNYTAGTGTLAVLNIAGTITGTLSNGLIVFSPGIAVAGAASMYTFNVSGTTGITTGTESHVWDTPAAIRTWTGTGATLAIQRDYNFQALTYNVNGGTQTFTKAGTVVITGAPIAGAGATITNPYALWVQSGLAQFDGGLAGSLTGNATTVTTNANLTGPVTSSGNATTIANSINLPVNPTTTTQAAADNSTKIATTAYVDAGISAAIAGVNPAVAVSYATTAAGDTSGLTYANGVSGVGATMTGVNNTVTTIDGHAFVIGDVGVKRILIKNDTQAPSGAFNGVYLFTALHTAGTGDIFTRAVDYDTPSDINNTGAIPVISGTANALTSWLLTSQVATVGTSPLTYSQFSVNPSLTVGATVTIVDDTATNATMYPVWVTTNTGNLPLKVSSTKMSFNPSTGNLTATTFTGALAGNATSATTATTATNATNTAITDDTATNATMYPTWVTTASGNQAQKVSSSKLSFNPSTGTLTTTTVIAAFSGNLTGDVTGNVNLVDLKQVVLSAPTTDGSAVGPSTSAFNSGYSSTAVGDLVYLDSSATWQKADNTTSVTTYGGVLGIALAVVASGNPVRVALPGSFVYASAIFPTFTIGAPVYMSTTAAVIVAQPSASGAAIRVVGWGIHADKMYFNPSADYVIHV